jgi:hypothetical protein
MVKYLMDDTFENKIRQYMVDNNHRIYIEIIRPLELSLQRTLEISSKEFHDSVRDQNKAMIQKGIANDITFGLGLPYDDCYSFVEAIDLNALKEYNHKYETN